MSFSVTLFDCADDPRALNKTLSGETPVKNVRPTGVVDLMAPTFELSYDAAYTTKNYLVALAPFNRSYFITDMRIDIGKKIYISCVVDVLATYRADISRISANVVRQENLTKEMLPDPNYVYINENDVISKLITYSSTGDFRNIFDSNLNQFTIVLGVAGYSNTHVNDVPGFTLLASEPADWSMRYIFYWVNTGGTTDGAMISIGQLVNAGTLPAGVSYNDVVAAYGGVYSKDAI